MKRIKHVNTPQSNNHPEKPAWFKNLEKARQVRHASSLIKKSLKTNESNKGNAVIPDSERSDEDILYGPEIRYEETPLPDPREALYEPELWFDHCEKVGKTNAGKVGRPKLPPEKLKRKPMSRNQEVRLMLSEHGITIDDDNNVILSNGNALFGYKFLVNGRVRDSESITMSAHQMLQLI